MLEFLEPVRRPHAALPPGILPDCSLCAESTTRTPVLVDVVTFFAATTASDVSVTFVVPASGWRTFTAHVSYTL